MKSTLSLIILMTLSLTNIAQNKNIAQQLGYDKNAKLLIIHADDVGVSHSENKATIKAFEQHAISSASIMVPCPWFPEIANYATKNPNKDFGLHLTLTAEWQHFKWGGVLPANEISSLLDSKGYFYSSTDEFSKHANPIEVEKELMAQVQKAIDFGVDPTHLDSHMGSLFTTPELFKIYIKVGAAFNLPVFIPKRASVAFPEITKDLEGEQILVDKFYMMQTNRSKKEWTNYYIDIINKLEPGLNVLLVHLAYDNAEMQAITINHPDFGATWRQNDLDALLDKDFKSALVKNEIQLVTWGQIKNILNQE